MGGGGGGGGSWDHMSSNDVGSYEFKRSPCEVQVQERGAHLARSTSDGPLAAVHRHVRRARNLLIVILVAHIITPTLNN